MIVSAKWVRSGCRHVLIAAIAPACVAWQAIPAWAQTQPAAGDITIIPNTASASFQETPGGPRVSTTSNQTTVPARVGTGQLELIKTGDRAAAEPGDTVSYRLLVKNTGTVTVTDLEIEDALPLGLNFIARSVRAGLTTNNQTVEVAIDPPTVSGRNIRFTYPRLEPKQTLVIFYAAIVTPDAIRGNGRNLAVASANTPTGRISSNNASHLLQIRPGILSDCGTIIGRVFVDKNFDGEQQAGEPGVPNAVIYMDDGNRITTDANGLFSMNYALPGYRTGTLDLTSLPGYTIAPNLYWLAGNSPSRLVRLAPGSTVRMNFAVTPTFGEGGR